tara:strand:+ start:228 stop:533 length:306 start_codon:yes stop_codon:yes gene_type:complete
MNMLPRNMRLSVEFAFIGVCSAWLGYYSSGFFYPKDDTKPIHKPCEKRWFAKIPLPGGGYSYKPYEEEPSWEVYDDNGDLIEPETMNLETRKLFYVTAFRM